MNRWQIAKQIAWLLTNKTWPDAPNEKVFGKAFVSDLPLEVVYTSETVPFVQVKPLAGESDADTPAVDRVAHVELVIATEGWTDIEGASTLVGGNRVPPSGGLTHQGTSQGRGLLEIEEVARQACTSTDGTAGFLCACRTDATSELQVLPGGVLVSTVKLAIDVYNASRDRTYAAPRMLTASGAAGVVSLTWALPAARWDSLGLVLVYQTGASAPAAPNLGTPVSVNASDTSKAVSTGAGTWSFSIFRSYDETGNGIAERYSPFTTIATATAVAA